MPTITKLLLLFGPPGVGKSAIIRNLELLDSRFVYISPYVTRPLRQNETDKISISSLALDGLMERGDLLTINELYGVRYGTPRKPIDEALNVGRFPVIDWPIQRLEIMQNAFSSRLFRVYLEPPSMDVLRQRLVGRDGQIIQERWGVATEELDALGRGSFDLSIDYRVINEESQTRKVACSILNEYLRDICKQGHGGS